MRNRKRLIAILVMMLFCFQFFAPLVEMGTAHTPKKCEKLKEKWQKKLKKEIEKNQAVIDLLKAGGSITAALKGALKGAGIGAAAVGAGGAAAGGLLGPPGAAAGAAKGAIAGGVGGSVAGAIHAFLAHREKLRNARKAYDKAKEESKKAKEEYDKCMKHKHASGSLIPYMDSPTNLAYGDTHYALYQANTPYYAVYWYVKGPDETGYGTLMSTDMGDGSKMSSTFSWTAPHKVGSYQLTAHVYFTDTILDSTYYISVF